MATISTCSARSSKGAASPMARAAAGLPSQPATIRSKRAGSRWMPGTTMTGRPLSARIAPVKSFRLGGCPGSTCSTTTRSKQRANCGTSLGSGLFGAVKIHDFGLHAGRLGARAEILEHLPSSRIPRLMVAAGVFVARLERPVGHQRQVAPGPHRRDARFESLRERKGVWRRRLVGLFENHENISKHFRVRENRRNLERTLFPRLASSSLIYRNGPAAVKIFPARRSINALLALIRVWRTKREEKQ